MSFQLVPKSVTLNDFMQQSIVFLVRVQCRRKESSRSLSHLLMSFLIIVLLRCLSSLCTCTFVTCYIKYQSINQCTYLDLDSAAVHVDK